ncbi:MAG: lipase family protein [Alphaproteobacteria bacterium]|nr:lipase family protein [Alphaproteobacteria bacterium]
MKSNTMFITFFSLIILFGFQSYAETTKERILSLFPMHFTQQELDRLKDQEPVFRNDLFYSMNGEEAQKLASSYPSKIQILTGGGFPDRVFRTDIIMIESDKAASATYVAKGAYYGETRFEIKVERFIDANESLLGYSSSGEDLDSQKLTTLTQIKELDRNFVRGGEGVKGNGYDKRLINNLVAFFLVIKKLNGESFDDTAGQTFQQGRVLLREYIVDKIKKDYPIDQNEELLLDEEDFYVIVDLLKNEIYQKIGVNPGVIPSLEKYVVEFLSPLGDEWLAGVADKSFEERYVHKDPALLKVVLLPVSEHLFHDIEGSALDESSFHMVEDNNNNNIIEDFDKNIGQFAKATDIDDDTIDCIDLSILAFHFYLQGKNKEEFDVAVETVRNKTGFFGGSYVAERHLAQKDPKWDRWYFKPFYGIGGSKLLQSYRTPGVHGMVAFNPSKNLIVVTYRGTQRGKEWLGQNFNFVKKQPVLAGIEGSALKDFDGWVHAGYWNLFETTKDEIEASIKEFLLELEEEERKDVKLVFTGHSLGGATATLAAGYFASQDTFKGLEKEIRTFGSPKVAGEDFKLWLEARVPGKSFARETDPVPSFPLRVRGKYFQTTYPLLMLDSFGDTSLNLDAAHDARKYQQAIYALRNIPYEKMYIKGAELLNK